MPAYDAIVIGAGPAGSAAAITLHQVGLRCLIVDQSDFPRSRPGESLHPGVQSIIKSLGCEGQFLAADFRRFDGIHVQWASESRFEPFGHDQDGPWRGFQAVRSVFDRLLLDRAIGLGAEVRQPCRAVAPVVSGGRVAGLQTSDGIVSADFVIDAAGGSHWMARQLGIDVHEHSPKLFAQYGYCTRVPYDGEIPAIVADDRGWTWYSQVERDLFHWTRLNIFGEKERREFNQTTYQRGADVTWRICSRIAGPGYFMAGDSSAVLDPASSHGVLRALMSGMLVANVIHKVQTSPNHEDELVQRYHCWSMDWFRHDRYRLLKSYRDAPFNPAWVGQAVA